MGRISGFTIDWPVGIPIEDGRTFISHALVKGRYTLRVAIGNVRTERRHLQTFLQAFREAVAAESPQKP